MTKNVELKGRTFTLSVLQLLDNDLESALKVLTEKVNKAPVFFNGAPVVVDVSLLSQQPNFETLKTTIQKTGMIVVGITGCKNQLIKEAATRAGLAVLNSAKPSRTINEPTYLPAKIITSHVRSGQQVYAKGSDLIVLNNVSAGAEIIADGNIHVYGVLRGRAIAGARGQKDALIFCHRLQPELISIAGTYWLNEAIRDEYTVRPVKISLDSDSLNIDYLTL